MDLNTILTGINSWNKTRLNASTHDILLLFDQGNGFKFDLTNIPAAPVDPIIDKETVHAYLGLLDGKLHYFLIDSYADTEEQFQSEEGILPYIAVCPVSCNPFPMGDGQDIISQEEAADLMGNWDTGKKAWIEDSKLSESGLYQVMVIPYNDILVKQVNVAFFGLNTTDDCEVYEPDLVIVNAGRVLQNYYHDLVRPVPPFKYGGELDKNKFFLLKLALG